MASEAPHERPTGPPAAGSGPTRAEGRSGRPARPCARPVCILGPPRRALHRTAEGHTPSPKGFSSPVSRPPGTLCAAPWATPETSWRERGRGVIRGLDLGWEAPPSCGRGPRPPLRSKNCRARNLRRRVYHMCGTALISLVSKRRIRLFSASRAPTSLWPSSSEAGWLRRSGADGTRPERRPPPGDRSPELRAPACAKSFLGAVNAGWIQSQCGLPKWPGRGHRTCSR